MAENDPLGDIFTLFAAPIAGTIRSVEQFRTGVDEFLRGVENFNRTMANLNETTERINRLLADVEGPIRAAVPQFTRSVQAADEMIKVVSGPAKAAAPALSQIADAMANPAFQQLPARIAQFNEMMQEMGRRLDPLTQIAESAGGLFGGLRLPGMPAPSSRATRPTPPPAAAVPDERSVDEATDAEDDTERSSAAGKPAARKRAKKVAGRKPAAKKSSAKKAAAKRSTAKPPAAKKSTAKKSAAKKSAARKAAGGAA